MAEEGSPFSPQCPPRLWPSCAADGAIRTALALPPPWNLPVLVRASGGTHGDTIFGENDTSARLASELLAQVVPPLFHYLCSPARINICDCQGYQLSHWPVTGKTDIKRLRARCQFRASWRAYNPPGHGPPSAHRRRSPG